MKTALKELILVCGLFGTGCHSHPPTGDNQINQTFKAAVEAKGQVYLDAEQELLTGGRLADHVLNSNLNNPDPVAKAIAVNLLKMKRGQAPGNSDAFLWIDVEANSLRRTVAGANMGAVLAAESIFGNQNTKPAEYVALRFLKQEDWPEYRNSGVTSYLEKAKDTRTTALLIRFIVETNDSRLCSEAIEVIQSIHDPKLDEKIEAERIRAQKQGLELPPVLEALRKTGK